MNKMQLQTKIIAIIIFHHNSSKENADENKQGKSVEQNRKDNVNNTQNTVQNDNNSTTEVEKEDANEVNDEI